MLNHINRINREDSLTDNHKLVTNIKIINRKEQFNLNMATLKKIKTAISNKDREDKIFRKLRTIMIINQFQNILEQANNIVIVPIKNKYS